jgi:hypothetical protein
MTPHRVDIGRKLFSDEHAMKDIISPEAEGHPTNIGGGHNLGPGIDFVKT